MEVHLLRHGDQCKIGTAQMKIPTDRSALAIFGTNPVINGGVFAEDGWIYVDGKKVRKWYIRVEQTTIWEPILSDIKKLEARYTAMKKRFDKFLEGEFTAAFNAVRDVGKAHAEPTHKYTGDKTWWLYNYSKHGSEEGGIGFEWVDQPTKPLHPEIGQKYYVTERKLSRYGGYAYRFKSVLAAAILKYLQKNVKGEDDKVVDLCINGNHYIYKCTKQYQNYFSYERLVWPRDKYEKVEA